MRLPSALVLLLTSTLTPACADPKFGGTSDDTGDTAQTDTDTTPASNLAQVGLYEGHCIWLGNGDDGAGETWNGSGDSDDIVVEDSVIMVIACQESGSYGIDYEVLRGTDESIDCSGFPNQSFTWSDCFQVMATPE